MQNRHQNHEKTQCSENLLRPLIMTSFAEILSYENERVVDYFCHLNPAYTREESKTLFKDLLAWIWLNLQREKLGKKSYLFGPLLQLDAMWHAFILHTQDYSDFCWTYLGHFFHHEVEPPGKEHSINEYELRDYLEDCIAYINQDWVTRRFLETEI